MALVLDSEAILGAVSPARAVELTRESFERHHRGEWEMPAKVYVSAPPGGDFRAMPARGSGYASLKWVTSFPGNPERGLPVVAGALLLSSAETGALLAILDCATVTSLRTGAAAAVSAQALARPSASSVGIVGCGVNGAWAARCLNAVGYGPGLCADIREAAAADLAEELGWRVAGVSAALECDVVVTVTPGEHPVIGAGRMESGSHYAVLGADAKGKAEVDPTELGRCEVFCDEWAQASVGGELAGPSRRGELDRAAVTELGAVLCGEHLGRAGADSITLFDSTGLATQDLAIAIAAYEEALAAGTAPAVELGGE